MTTLLLGGVVHRLGLVMISLQTKFEVSMFTHYEDMGATQNVEIGWFGDLGVT